MLEHLFVVPEDPLLRLIGAFKSDKRADKIDLGVGVYRNEQGLTPVMEAVKRAEHILLETQDSKAYIGLAGDVEFLDEMGHLVFGGIRPKKSRFAYLQTPGASAALRLGGDIIKRSNDDATIWIGLPCWSNHIPIFNAAKLKIETYSYYDEQKRRLDQNAVFEALKTAKTGDIILLQGCCHNPTGVDFSLSDWVDISRICVERGLIPFIDMAYQGLGQGLSEDLQGLNVIMETVPEALIAVSCSKNFGLYRERTGALYVMAPTIEKAKISLTNLFDLARTSYSMPPDHGAAIVKTILRSPELKQLWENELRHMRKRIAATRKAIIENCGTERFGYMQSDQGMFSLLPLTASQIARLRDDHAIYMAGNGRINIAGLKPDSIGQFSDALHSVL